MPPRDWSPRFLESTRGRIVTRLRRSPATVEELAQAVDLTENGVRIHLATLERDGWIQAEGVRRPPGPGKPPTLYRLAAGVEPLLSTAYRPLLLALLEVLRVDQPAARVSRMLRSAGRRLAESIGPVPARSGSERAAGMLRALGAEVQVEEGRAGRFTVRGFGCPIGDAVAVEPRACQAVSSLLGGVLGARVVDRCDREGAARCRFEVSPKR